MDRGIPNPHTDPIAPPAAQEDIEETGDVRQYISFTIGREEYGIDIICVREIKVWTECTAVPNSPDYVRGVVNLRGIIVPIYDLRARFGRGLTRTTALHVYIIVKVGPREVGILVDTVSDILTVSDRDLLPVPDGERDEDAAYLTNLVIARNRMVALLSLGRLFAIGGGNADGDLRPAFFPEAVRPGIGHAGNGDA